VRLAIFEKSEAWDWLDQSRDARETLEARLKEGTLPTTAVTTATLELGIDIGSVETVAQLGAPRSTSALRQRLGRSGRRAGKPAVLRIYTVEQELEARSSLLDRLRLETVQSIATVQLLLARWIEPPSPLTLHLKDSVIDDEIVAQVHFGMTAVSSYTGHDRAAAKGGALADPAECDKDLKAFTDCLEQVDAKSKAASKAREAKLKAPKA
jgi:superfamily II DNA/RNA helicase